MFASRRADVVLTAHYIFGKVLSGSVNIRCDEGNHTVFSGQVIHSLGYRA